MCSSCWGQSILKNGKGKCLCPLCRKMVKKMVCRLPSIAIDQYPTANLKKIKVYHGWRINPIIFENLRQDNRCASSIINTSQPRFAPRTYCTGISISSSVVTALPPFSTAILPSDHYRFPTSEEPQHCELVFYLQIQALDRSWV